MVEKFPDGNKPKTSLNDDDLIQFHLICQMLARFLALNSKGPYLCLEKKKKIFALCFVKRVRESRKFHVAVVQRRLRNVQKRVMHVQSCCFGVINLLLFSSSLCRRRISSNFTTLRLRKLVFKTTLQLYDSSCKNWKIGRIGET